MNVFEKAENIVSFFVVKAKTKEREGSIEGVLKNH